MTREKLREEVESMLIKFPDYRNDVQSVISTIWLIESAELGCENVYEFLKCFSEKKLTPISIIKLTKRQVQAKNPELN